MDKQMNMQNKMSFWQVMKKSFKSFSMSFPVLGFVILMLGLVSLIPKTIFSKFFSYNVFIDSFIGAALGSVLAGNPITSYILGGEFLNQGVSLIAVTAFIVSWVTVGVVQYPAEAHILGKKFALYRNLISFIFSILVAIITVMVINLW